MPVHHLDNRALLTISGPDAAHFLHNLVTADVERLAEGAAQPAALLTPQGKVMFVFLLIRTGGDRFAIDAEAASADDLFRRLTMYKLRAKVEISKQNQNVVAVCWEVDSPGSQVDSTRSGNDPVSSDLESGASDLESGLGAATDLRFAAFAAETNDPAKYPHPLPLPSRGRGEAGASVGGGKLPAGMANAPGDAPPSPSSLRGGVRGGGEDEKPLVSSFGQVIRISRAPPPQTATAADWTALRIAAGVPEPGIDFALGDAFPHDIGLDQNGGVAFRKGCYVGQEVVSRMQHRGTARRRVMIVRGETDLPETATAIDAGGKPAGALGSVCGRDGLAILRLDRVKAALDAGAPVTAGGVILAFAFPPGVTYGWPDGATAEGD